MKASSNHGELSSVGHISSGAVGFCGAWKQLPAGEQWLLTESTLRDSFACQSMSCSTGVCVSDCWVCP